MKWALFRTFFKIGLFTFGGGYVMVTIIETDVVERKKWMNKDEFYNLVVVAQTCPGVFAVNVSTFIGYKLCKVPGAIVSAIGAALPSFLVILIIASVFREFQDIPVVAAAMRGIRPAVVALIAAPTFSLAKNARLNIYTCWIPIVSALLIWACGVNPVIVLLAAAFLGYLSSTRLFT